MFFGGITPLAPLPPPKAHKKRVKAEQRAKRDNGDGGGMPNVRGTEREQRASHKPNRKSCGAHRGGGASAITEHHVQLEALFGEGLAGLSGLALADDHIDDK